LCVSHGAAQPDRWQDCRLDDRRMPQKGRLSERGPTHRSEKRLSHHLTGALVPVRDLAAAARRGVPAARTIPGSRDDPPPATGGGYNDSQQEPENDVFDCNDLHIRRFAGSLLARCISRIAMQRLRGASAVSQLVRLTLAYRAADCERPHREAPWEENSSTAEVSRNERMEGSDRVPGATWQSNG
jgi:hypothetical protein